MPARRRDPSRRRSLRPAADYFRDDRYRQESRQLGTLGQLSV